MHELSVTRYIDAAPYKVWEIMTGRLGEWWAPSPWKTRVETLEQRPGGVSHLVLEGPDGERNDHKGFVLAWEPGKRFSITDAIEPDLRPSGPFMLGIWSLAPEGIGTQYTASARHWTKEAMEQHRELGFEQGWGMCADQLKALCEG